MKEVLKPIVKSKVFLYCFNSIYLLFSLYLPILLKNITDLVAAGNIGAEFWRICFIYMAFLLLDFTGNLCQNYIWHSYIKTAVCLHRKFVLHEILAKPLSFFRKFKQGDLVNRLLRDAEMYGTNQAVSKLMIVLNCLNLVGALLFMSSINGKMALLILVYIPLYFFVFKGINKKLRSYGKAERELYTPLLSRSNEMLGSIESIHYDGQTAFFEERYNGSLDAFLQGEKRLQKYRSLGLAFNTFFLNLLPFAVLVVGGFFVVEGSLSLGGLFAFYAYLQYLSEPIQNLTDVNINLHSAAGSKERLEEILQYQGEEKQGEALREPIFQLAFKHLDFAYEEGKTILSDFSLALQTGDRLAILGPSGVGKSTLIKLLLGQLQGKRGQVELNAKALQDWDSQSYISKIAYVKQEPFLFEGNVLENIAYNKREGLEQAYEIACLDSISTLEALAEKPVLPNGDNLSGGERQRIALARGILKDADLLILDEPTSALDAKTEQRFVENLDKYLADGKKIMLCISHRPAILEICNKELVLSGDGLVELKDRG